LAISFAPTAERRRMHAAPFVYLASGARTISPWWWSFSTWSAGWT